MYSDEEPTGLPDGLNVGYERRKGGEDHCWVFGLSNKKDWVAIYCDGDAFFLWEKRAF